MEYDLLWFISRAIYERSLRNCSTNALGMVSSSLGFSKCHISNSWSSIELCLHNNQPSLNKLETVCFLPLKKNYSSLYTTACGELATSFIATTSNLISLLMLFMCSSLRSIRYPNLLIAPWKVRKLTSFSFSLHSDLYTWFSSSGAPSNFIDLSLDPQAPLQHTQLVNKYKVKVKKMVR